MDIFSLFTLCGGLAFFLYGMTTMSKSLEKMAGGFANLVGFFDRSDAVSVKTSENLLDTTVL